MERSASERRIRNGCMRCHGMRGRRKKDTDGPMEALRKYGQEEGWSIRAEEVRAGGGLGHKD